MRTTLFRDFTLQDTGYSWLVKSSAKASGVYIHMLVWFDWEKMWCLKLNRSETIISSQTLDKKTNCFQWLYPLARSASSLLTPWESRRDRKVTSELFRTDHWFTLHQQMQQEGKEKLCPRKYWLFHRLQPQTTGAVILMHLCTSSAVRIPLLHSPWGRCRLVSSCKSADWPLRTTAPFNPVPCISQQADTTILGKIWHWDKHEVMSHMLNRLPVLMWFREALSHELGFCA